MRGHQLTGLLSRAPEGRLDLGGEEVEIELVRLVRLERMKAESFPPGASGLVVGGHDYCSACGLLVQLDGRGEDVDSERGPDPEAGVALIDSKPAEQQRRNGMRRYFGERGSGSARPWLFRRATSMRLVARSSSVAARAGSDARLRLADRPRAARLPVGLWPG